MKGLVLKPQDFFQLAPLTRELISLFAEKTLCYEILRQNWQWIAQNCGLLIIQ
jgi:hypothetical protein